MPSTVYNQNGRHDSDQLIQTPLSQRLTFYPNEYTGAGSPYNSSQSQLQSQPTSQGGGGVSSGGGNGHHPGYYSRGQPDPSGGSQYTTASMNPLSDYYGRDMPSPRMGSDPALTYALTNPTYPPGYRPNYPLPPPPSQYQHQQQSLPPSNLTHHMYSGYQPQQQPMPSQYTSHGYMLSNNAVLDELIYQVQFKNAFRYFIVPQMIPPMSVRVSDFVKVEADRGEDLGVVTEVIPMTTFMDRRFNMNSSLDDESFQIGKVIRIASLFERQQLQQKYLDEQSVVKVRSVTFF